MWNDDDKLSTESQYIVVYSWSIDFWMAFLERPKIFRWLTRVMMGRYAWNELMGMKIHFDKYNDYVGIVGYSCKNQDYHEELDKFKNW